MHIVTLHSSWASYHRHASLDSFERCRQRGPGLLPGEKITRGFRIPYGLRELIECIQRWCERFQHALCALRRGFSPEPLRQPFFQKLELIPEQEEEPIVPFFVEDEDDIKWDEDGQNILKERSGTGFSALLNHVSPAIASPKLLSRACVTIDTRKPWHPLERQIRSIFPDPEPLLYRLRRQRISTFTAREKKVYVLCRNGAGEREIGCILGLKRERLAKILETIAWKLGVHTAEISRFEPI